MGMILVIDTTIHHHRFLGRVHTYLRRRGYEHVLLRDLAGLRALEERPGFLPREPRALRILITGSQLSTQDVPPPLAALLDHLLTARRYRHTPIMGICFGAQYIARHLGLTMHRMEQEVCRRVAVPEMGIRPHFCIHELVYPDAVSQARVDMLGTAIMNHHRVIVAFQHRTRPLVGTLFHPEWFPSTYPILDAFLDA